MFCIVLRFSCTGSCDGGGGGGGGQECGIHNYVLHILR